VKNNLRYFSILLGGTVLTQILNISTYPLLTRIYSPEMFGYFGILFGVCGLFSGVSSLGMQFAFYRNQDDVNNHLILKIGGFFCLLFSIVVIPLLIMGYKMMAFNLSSDYELENVDVIFISTLVFVTGIYSLAENLNLKLKRAKQISKAVISATVITILLRIVSGLIEPSSYNLVVSYLIGSILFIIIVLRNVDIYELVKYRVTFDELKGSLINYKSLIIYRSSQTLINNFSLNLPLYSITYIFDLKNVGYFVLARTFMSLPSRLIGKSLGDYTLSKCSSIVNNHKKYRDLNNKLVSIAFCIALVPYSLIYIYGGEIFALFLGGEWYLSGEIAGALSIWLFTLFVTSPTAKISVAAGLSKIDFIFTIFKSVVRVLSLGIAYYYTSDVVNFVTVFSYASAATNVVYFILINWCLSGKCRQGS